jgi:glycerol-3-phosphate dehydrogenase (NAD(P)+)
MVFGSYDIKGVELAGVLKNVISIASGIVTGLGFGDNTRAMLISRGLIEMTRIAEVLGAEPKSFFGLAGIGDLIATCMSKYSRNHSVGWHLSQGESIQSILDRMTEPAEGVNTLKICYKLSKQYKIHTPIVDALYDIVFQQLSIQQGLARLMSFPSTTDVDII